MSSLAHQSYKRTRIVATVGPASAEPAIFRKLVSEGVNVARLNFSHGTYPEHARFITMVRTAARRLGTTVSVLQDLCGPKIRVGDLPPDGVQLVNGETIIFSNNVKRRNAIPFQYAGLPRDVHKGDQVLLDDGLLELEVLGTTAAEVSCRVIVGGKLTSHKGINVPSATLRVPAITEKDKKDLVFGLAHGVDAVALSFVRSPRDVTHLRELIARARPRVEPFLFVKIEKHEAIEHLEEIVHAADGVMVARGDLGIEVAPELVPLLQKKMVRLCNDLNKPVIVATQMLDSMIRNPRPTRAEISDVANAVLDMTDGVMLSGESASGAYPVEAVSYMARTARVVEGAALQAGALVCHHRAPAPSQVVGELAFVAAELEGVAAIVVLTESSDTVRALSRMRLPCTIIAQASDEHLAARMNFYYGVAPVVAHALTRGGMLQSVLRAARKRGLAARGDRVVVLRSRNGRGALLSLEEVRVS